MTCLLWSELIPSWHPWLFNQGIISFCRPQPSKCGIITAVILKGCALFGHEKENIKPKVIRSSTVTCRYIQLRAHCGLGRLSAPSFSIRWRRPILTRTIFSIPFLTRSLGPATMSSSKLSPRASKPKQILQRANPVRC